MYNAADLHGVKRPFVLLGILHHETGTIGHVSKNKNGSVDIGPFQINSQWIPRFARYWNTTERSAYQSIRDNWCAAASAAAIILGLAIDEENGDLWKGVGRYHSPKPALAAPYAHKVAVTVRRFYRQSQVAQSDSPGASQGDRAMLR